MLALISGRGLLPQAVSEAHGAPVLTCALAGHAPDGLTPDITFALETLGSLFETLKSKGVDQVCFCGSIDRPRLDPEKLDAATAAFVPRFMEALGLGDDGALRIVLQLFEEQGFKVLAPHEASPALLPPAGYLTGTTPQQDVLESVARGDAALAQMGQNDLGQSCILSGGIVVLTEDESGTDALIQRAPKDAVLFKAPKPGQERRADLPVIGPATAANAVKAGLRGIVIEAGGVMVLNQSDVLRRLNQAGLFLWVREAKA